MNGILYSLILLFVLCLVFSLLDFEDYDDGE